MDRLAVSFLFMAHFASPEVLSDLISWRRRSRSSSFNFPSSRAARVARSLTASSLSSPMIHGTLTPYSSAKIVSSSVCTLLRPASISETVGLCHPSCLATCPCERPAISLAILKRPAMSGRKASRSFTCYYPHSHLPTYLFGNLGNRQVSPATCGEEHPARNLAIERF